MANEADHAALRERLLGRKVHAPATLPGIVAAYGALALVVVISLIAAFKMMTTHVRVETKTKIEVPKSATGLQKALGAGQSVPGETINTNLKGATCAVYQPSDGLIIVCR